MPKGLALPPVSSTRLESAKSTKFARECPECLSLTLKVKIAMAEKSYEDVLSRFGPNDLMTKTARDNYASYKGNVDRQLKGVRNNPNVDGWTCLR